MSEYVVRLVGLVAGHVAVVAYSLAVLAGLALVSTVVYLTRRPAPARASGFVAISDVRTLDGDLQTRRFFGPAATSEEALRMAEAGTALAPVPPYCYLETNVLDLSAAGHG